MFSLTYFTCNHRLINHKTFRLISDSVASSPSLADNEPLDSNARGIYSIVVLSCTSFVSFYFLGKEMIYYHDNRHSSV